MAPAPTRVIVQLRDAPEEAARLKRLALLFDAVHFVRPLGAGITDEALADPARFSITRSNELRIHDFNYFRDVRHGYARISLDPQLQETLDGLTEAGVAIDATDLAWSAESDVGYRDIRAQLLARDMGDAQWNRMTGTKARDYNLQGRISRILLEELDANEEKTWWFLQEPAAVFAADFIGSTSYVASRVGGAPAFDGSYRDLLAYRYEQFKAGISSAPVGDPNPIATFGHRFGEVAFSVASTVFSSDSVGSRSVADILRYRDEMDVARRRFISQDLVDLSSLVEDNPWDANAREEVERYVAGKLNSDTAAFDEISVTTWEKLHGSLTVRAGAVAQAAGFGAGAGGVAGNVIPHTSVWGMLLGGALAGASKEFPRALQDIVDAFREDRRLRRSGVAYVARFEPRRVESNPRRSRRRGSRRRR